jgi:hypothetical protein
LLHTAWSRMTESVGNKEIWQIWNLPSKVNFCNSINITDITKNIFNDIWSGPIIRQKIPVFFNCFIANRLRHCWSAVVIAKQAVAYKNVTDGDKVAKLQVQYNKYLSLCLYLYLHNFCMYVLAYLYTYTRLWFIIYVLSLIVMYIAT